jgi:hypothetical protein
MEINFMEDHIDHIEYKGIEEPVKVQYKKVQTVYCVFQWDSNYQQSSLRGCYLTKQDAETAIESGLHPETNDLDEPAIVPMSVLAREEEEIEEEAQQMGDYSPVFRHTYTNGGVGYSCNPDNGVRGLNVLAHSSEWEDIIAEWILMNQKGINLQGDRFLFADGKFVVHVRPVGEWQHPMDLPQERTRVGYSRNCDQQTEYEDGEVYEAVYSSDTDYFVLPDGSAEVVHTRSSWDDENDVEIITTTHPPGCWEFYPNGGGSYGGKAIVEKCSPDQIENYLVLTEEKINGDD